MASTREFVEFVLNQLTKVNDVRSKSMFGEYGIFSDRKMFGVICDNKLFIKPTEGGRSFIGKVTEAPPYPGAKNYFLIEEKLDDPEWLSNLVVTSLKEIPIPKPRKKKRKSGK